MRARVLQGTRTNVMSRLSRRGRCCEISSRRIAETQRWLDQVVIGRRLCPFAKAVREPPALRLCASFADNLDEVVEEVAREARGLRTSQFGAETTLLILRDSYAGLSLGYMELLSLSWRLQEEVIVGAGHATHVQIVLFHPKATHSTYTDAAAPADAGDYTIRSPHPMIHLLRESDILRAVQQHPDAAGIPGRNRTRLREDGLDACMHRLERCSLDR